MHLNSDVISGLSQAVATISAVVIGFGLSWWSERAGRKHVLEASSRDRKLTTIIDAMLGLSTARALLAAAHDRLAGFATLADATATQQASKRAQEGSLRNALAQDADLIRSVVDTLGRLGLTFAVFGLTDSGRSVLSDAATCLGSLARDLSTNSFDAPALSAQLDETMDILDRSLGRLLDEGKSLA